MHGRLGLPFKFIQFVSLFELQKILLTSVIYDMTREKNRTFIFVTAHSKWEVTHCR